MARPRARRSECPCCHKDCSVKRDGTLRDHVDWADQLRIRPLCKGSGLKVAEDHTNYDGS